VRAFAIVHVTLTVKQGRRTEQVQHTHKLWNRYGREKNNKQQLAFIQEYGKSKELYS